MIGEWEVDGKNKNCEHLEDACVERWSFLTNTFFQHERFTDICDEIVKGERKRGKLMMWL